MLTLGRPARAAAAALLLAGLAAAPGQATADEPRPAAPLTRSAAAAPWVQVVAPHFEAPGGTVPVVVTVHAVPSGAAVALDVVADRGATASCTGGTWTNPVRRSTSRTCYLTTPRQRGAYRITGRAALTRDGGTTVLQSLPRPFTAAGPATRPLPPATIRQIERCYRTSSAVQLTFDDAFQSAGDFRSIRATLKRNGVRAVFFGVRGWALPSSSGPCARTGTSSRTTPASTSRSAGSPTPRSAGRSAPAPGPARGRDCCGRRTARVRSPPGCTTWPPRRATGCAAGPPTPATGTTRHPR